MKVKTLIDRLQKLDPNLEVVSDNSGQPLQKLIVELPDMAPKGSKPKVWLEFKPLRF